MVTHLRTASAVFIGWMLLKVEGVRDVCGLVNFGADDLDFFLIFFIFD